MTKFFFFLIHDKLFFLSITRFFFIHDKILFYPWQNSFYPRQNSFLLMTKFSFIHDKILFYPGQNSFSAHYKTFFIHDKRFFLWQNSFSCGKILFQALTKFFLSVTKLFLSMTKLFLFMTRLFLSMTKLFFPWQNSFSHDKTSLSCDKWHDRVVESVALWVHFATRSKHGCSFGRRVYKGNCELNCQVFVSEDGGNSISSVCLACKHLAAFHTQGTTGNSISVALFARPPVVKKTLNNQGVTSASCTSTAVNEAQRFGKTKSFVEWKADRTSSDFRKKSKGIK